MEALPVQPLLVDGREVGAVEVATSFAQRSRGLLGRDGLDGGLVLRPATSVHTLRMRFTIDVVYVARDGRVLGVRTMRPQRMGLPRFRTKWILETAEGQAGRWGIARGSRLELGTA